MLKRIRSTKDEGFTLVELLIVIIILGILAAIVVFAVGSTRKDAVNASCKTNVKSIQLGAEAVKTKTGKYPAAKEGLLATSTSDDGEVLKTWPGGEAGDVDAEQIFAYAGTDNTYTLTVSGKNIAGAALTQDATEAQVETACSEAVEEEE